jgi:hypothetical protein
MVNTAYDQLPKQVNNFIQTNYLNKKDTITEIQQQSFVHRYGDLA